MAMDNFTATVFSDRASAFANGKAPAYEPPKLCGHQFPMQTGESTTIVVGLNFPVIKAVR